MKHEKESGFTLIEVLMAMALLAVGLLALGMMQAHFAEGNANSRQMIHATDVAASKIEELANAPDIDTGTDSETNKDYPLEYDLEWEVTEMDTATDETVLAIDMEVSWMTGGTSHSISFDWARAE